MNPKQKTHIQKTFLELMDKASCDDSFKKYLVSKTKDGYSYHDFVLIKNDKGFFDCAINEVVVFEEVSSFELAVSMCYNYLFKKSSDVQLKLNKLNETASKHKLDLYHYNSCLANGDYFQYCALQARINESKMLYNSILRQIRSLSKGL